MEFRRLEVPSTHQSGLMVIDGHPGRQPDQTATTPTACRGADRLRPACAAESPARTAQVQAGPCKIPLSASQADLSSESGYTPYHCRYSMPPR